MDSVKAPVRSNPEVWYAFIKAPRFWVMCLGILSLYLEEKGMLGEAEMKAIASFSALFIGISTYDKSVTKIAGGK